MVSSYIFWHYFNIKCSSVQFHYDKVSIFTFSSVNLIWKKCPIHLEFLDTKAGRQPYAHFLEIKNHWRNFDMQIGINLTTSSSGWNKI